MKKLASLLLLAVVLFVAATPALAAKPAFGQLYYNDTVVRTVIPPAAAPWEGTDNLYAVPDQKAVIAVAPGDTGYHGGHWAVHTVAWAENVAPYALTSEAAVLAAAAAGDIVITRVPGADFLCPVQP